MPVSPSLLRRREAASTAEPDAAGDGAAQPVDQQRLLAIQRSAGNAAVVQLLKQGGAAGGLHVLREPAPAEAAPAQAAPAGGAAGQAQQAGAPAAASGQTFGTDWFVDYSQVKQGAGAAGSRGKNDALFVQRLAVAHGSDAKVQVLEGFDASPSGPSHIGHIQHEPGAGHVSGNIQYIRAADIKVHANLSNAAKKPSLALHQQKVADEAAQAFVREQFNLEQGEEAALEQGATERADAALAADSQAAAGAGGDAAPTPMSKVDISVLGRHTDQPALPRVDYAINGDSNCMVNVLIPSKEYKGTVSGSVHTHTQDAHQTGDGKHDKDTSSGSVDVTAGGSQTTHQSTDVHLQEKLKKRELYTLEFAQKTHRAVNVSVSQSLNSTLMEIAQGAQTETKKTMPEIDTGVGDESQAKEQHKDDDPSLWDRAVGAVTGKLKDWITDKFWSWADKLAGKEYPIWRLVPGGVKSWLRHKATDLVWKGGKWLWNKITGGETEVKHEPDPKQDAGEGADENIRQTQTSSSAWKLVEEMKKATYSWATEVSEEARSSLSKELEVEKSVDVKTGSSKDTTVGGSGGIHASGGHEGETSSGKGHQEDTEKDTTRTYTTEVIRIETGRPLIELTVMPK